MDGEPSPLLPAWMELGLQPVRAASAEGLKHGSSPLLLPAAARRVAACEPVRAVDPGGAALLGGVMPSREVLERSEFLLPLGPRAAAMYRSVLGAE